MNNIPKTTISGFPIVTIEDFIKKAKEAEYTEQEINEMIEDIKKEAESEDDYFGLTKEAIFLEFLTLRYASIPSDVVRVCPFEHD